MGARTQLYSLVSLCGVVAVLLVARGVLEALPTAAACRPRSTRSSMGTDYRWLVSPGQTGDSSAFPHLLAHLAAQ